MDEARVVVFAGELRARADGRREQLQDACLCQVGSHDSNVLEPVAARPCVLRCGGIIEAWPGTALDEEIAMVLLNCRGVGCFVIFASVAGRFLPAAAQPAAAPPAAPVASPLPRERSEPDEPRAVGAMIGASIGLGTQSTLMLDGRIGAVVHPNIALFAEAMAVATGEGGVTFLGGGVRLAIERGFIDARFGRVHRSFSCDFDDPCISDAALGGVVGAGLELLHGKHAGLELRVDALRAFQGTVVEVGLGGSFYVF